MTMKLSEGQLAGEAIPVGAHYVALRIPPQTADDPRWLEMANHVLRSGDEVVEANLIVEGDQATFIAFRR